MRTGGIRVAATAQAIAVVVAAAWSPCNEQRAGCTRLPAAAATRAPVLVERAGRRITILARGRTGCLPVCARQTPEESVELGGAPTGTADDRVVQPAGAVEDPVEVLVLAPLRDGRQRSSIRR